MICPECGGKIKVMETAQTENNETYRRKKCLECGRLIFTAEYEVEPTEQFRTEWSHVRPDPYIRDNAKSREYQRNFRARQKAKKGA